MSAPRLARALAASAAVHGAVLAGLLALAHPRLAGPPPLRVALVEPTGRPAGGAAAANLSGDPPAPGAERPAMSSRPVPATGATAAVQPPAAASRSAVRPARRAETQQSAAAGPARAAAAEAVAMVTPVQSDLWVLGAPAGTTGPGDDTATASGKAASEAPGSERPSSSGAAAPATTGGKGEGAGSTPSVGPANAGGASLLAVLSQRLAWSAQRCAPPTVVRTARQAVPGVPLRFCLDAAGRPSDVGLLGTTGSEQLDRAARDCVIPGALPLPPVPGCYTVEVRFPTR